MRDIIKKQNGTGAIINSSQHGMKRSDMYSLRLKTTFDTVGTIYLDGKRIEALSELHISEADIIQIRELVVLANRASLPQCEKGDCCYTEANAKKRNCPGW